MVRECFKQTLSNWPHSFVCEHDVTPIVCTEATHELVVSRESIEHFVYPSLIHSHIIVSLLVSSIEIRSVRKNLFLNFFNPENRLLA